MAYQASGAMSRRHLVQAGLVGAVVSGMTAWGALPAMADEVAEQPAQGTAAAVDLAILSDDELVALEARIAQEKLTRGVNAAYIPAGRYVAGTDFDAGNYVIRCLTQDDDGHAYVSVCENAESGASIYERVEKDENLKVTLGEGYILKIDNSDCTIAPFAKLTFGKSSDDAAAQTAADASADQAVASDSDEVTPEFKELMDGYEAFMNSYCDFMKTYSDTSNSGDVAALSAMLGDYTTLMQQEVEWIDKIDAVDQSTLSAADLSYYLEVVGRVSQRLLEVSGSL